VLPQQLRNPALHQPVPDRDGRITLTGRHRVINHRGFILQYTAIDNLPVKFSINQCFPNSKKSSLPSTGPDTNDRVTLTGRHRAINHR